ncbi:hypothetical protein QQS21_005107 [Conoideocrella luteorostrata]|uniref:DUF726-domain-containing protein n=1 Tax=Conoideocrella luteorostrata TaxID=1105319 RepID=A0AAJ0CQC3_9HYPO|nr:hypothetical protein QQS21_005107 [Conoideocrella luteorostrata]
MGRGSRGSGHQTARRPVDLTGIISVAEKNDFVTLVNAITEKMHKDTSNMFDSPPVRAIRGEEQHHWLSLPLLHRRESNKENLSALNSFRGNVQQTPSTVYDKTHQIIQREENDAMTPQLRELKKEALAYFRKWQGNVLQRLREINVSDMVPSAPGSRGRGRGVRGGNRAGRGGRGGRGGAVATTLATGPPRTPANHVDPDLASRHPPIPNTLWTLHLERRKLLLHIALLIFISLQDYNANSRILLVCVASSLNLPFRLYQIDENRLAQGLARAALEVSPDEDGNLKSEETKGSRKWKLGLGGAAGASTPVSLAAPLRNVGIGTSQGGLGLTTTAAAGLLGFMAENGILMGSLFGMNPTKPLNKILETFLREIQDFAFIRLCNNVQYEYTNPRESPLEDRRLRVTVAISGCLLANEDITRPWRFLDSQTEVYAIRWETQALTNLGSALETVIKSTAWGSARRDIESKTIFQSLIDSIWPESLLRISKIIDNPWSVGMVRAEKAGAVLADSLMRQRIQGERPVSLIGYSLAARAIYACLMVLAERRQFGLVDSVVLIGTPAPSESRVWLTLKSVVSGRLVNVYSEQDYILGFLYRTSNIQFGIAGLQEIQGADGVENHSVKTLPRGHLSYPSLMGQILRDIGWEDLDVKTVRSEDALPLSEGGRKRT